MNRRRIAALVAAGAVAAGGTGVAVAATRRDDAKAREQAVLADAAKRLGTDADKLRDALAAAQDDQLDADVKAGRLTQEQADAVKARRKQAGTVLGRPGLGHRPGGRGFGRGLARGPIGNVVEAAAKAIGITQAQLIEALRDGKTLSEVAKDNGKDYADVKAAIRAAAKTELDAAVKDDRLTQTQADRLLARLGQRLDDGGQLLRRGPRFRHP
jgi:hypothetical protein